MVRGNADPFLSVRRATRVFARLQAELDRRLAHCGHTPTERRILVELRDRPGSLDAEIASNLGIDRSQLSRSITKLIDGGLVTHRPASRHKSQRFLHLTEPGERDAARLAAEQQEVTLSVFYSLNADDQNLFMRSMGAGPGEDFDQEEGVAVELRSPKPSDYAWLLDALIAEGRALGWGNSYIAKCARTISEFVEQPFGTEHAGWIAHRFQSPVGASLMILNDETSCAELVALWVMPRARSLGIGSSLLEASIREARELTMIAVTAAATERQDSLDRLLRKHRFNRGKASEPEYGFGRPEVWRGYRLNLPLSGFETGRPRSV